MSPFQPPNQPAKPPINFPGPANSGGPRHPNPDDLTLYAMQLLSTGEAAAITRHLDQCDECRAELARIHDDLAVYASTSISNRRPQPPASASSSRSPANRRSSQPPGQSPSRIIHP